MSRTDSERTDVLPLLAELFREHGYEGTSLSLITQATGLGKGSLYHFFPDGKEEMATAVLAEIDHWFEVNVFTPLAENDKAEQAITEMFGAVETYFHSGRRVCLVGVLALSDTRDRFARAVKGYFERWIEVLARALEKAGHDSAEASALSEEIVGGIQGAIVLSRALDNPSIFSRSMLQLTQLAVGRKPQTPRAKKNPGARRTPGFQ